jgi:hypothetical protein
MPMRRLSIRSSTQVEEIDAHENDQEATHKREGVLRARRSESLEEDEGGDDGGRREKDVVHGVDDVGGEGVEGLVEVVHPAEKNRERTEGSERDELEREGKRREKGNKGERLTEP